MVVLGKANFNKLDPFCFIRLKSRMRVYDGHLIKSEVSLDEGNRPSPYKPMTDDTNVVNMTVLGVVFHFLFKCI